jgi:hypothetical protein
MSLTVGDDMYFSTVNIPYLDWIKLRYNTWSGRLFPDTLAFVLLGHSFFLWQLINPVLIMLAAYAIVRLLSPKVEFEYFLVSLLTFGYFSKNVLSSSFFWSTGSLNYLWPIALGLIAMIPYSDYVREEKTINWGKTAFFVLIAFLSAISNEQVALCMSAFAILTHIFLFINHKTQNIKLLIITFIVLLGTAILLLAPGNSLRWVAEVERWYPGFDKFSLKDHLYIGAIWIFNKLFIDMKYLLALFSFVICYIYHKNEKGDLFYRVFFIMVLIVFSNMILGYNADILYNFNLIQQHQITNTLFHFSMINRSFIYALIPYIFWFTYMVLLFYLILKQAKEKWFVFFSLAASIASLVIMFFSPTIYASGNRVLAACSVLWSFVILKLIMDNHLIRNNNQIVIIGVLPLLSLVQLLIWWLTEGYHIMY